MTLPQKSYPWHYVLSGHSPTPEPDPQKWSQWFQSANRQVALDHIDPLSVSTSFLGRELNYIPQLSTEPAWKRFAKPKLFQTQISGGPWQRERRWKSADDARWFTWLSPTWADALVEHQKALQLAQLGPDELNRQILSAKHTLRFIHRIQGPWRRRDRHRQKTLDRKLDTMERKYRAQFNDR
jgi:hypothetical protein